MQCWLCFQSQDRCVEGHVLPWTPRRNERATPPSSGIARTLTRDAEECLFWGDLRESQCAVEPWMIVAAGLPVEKPLTLAASRVRLRSKADEQHSVDIRGFAMYGKPHEARPRTLGDVLFDQMASVNERYLKWQGGTQDRACHCTATKLTLSDVRHRSYDGVVREDQQRLSPRRLRPRSRRSR